MEEKTKKKSKVKKILLIIAAVIVAALIGLFIWQKDMIVAVYNGATKDKAELSAALDDALAEQQQFMDENGITVTMPTREDMEALLNGTMSEADFIEKLKLNEYVPVSVKEEAAFNEAAKPIIKEKERIKAVTQDYLNQCTAELYAVEGSAMAQLGAIRSDVLAQWAATEEKNSATKSQVISAGISRAYALEGSVDGQVQGIIGKYRGKIKEAGGDPSVLDGLWDQYCSIKAAQASYGMSLD